MTVALTIASVGTALSLGAFVGLRAGQIREVTANAIWAVANFATGCVFVFIDQPLLATWAAAVSAWCAYDWWNKGGGDGTRRRLKDWAGRFKGVRRTAPRAV